MELRCFLSGKLFCWFHRDESIFMILVAGKTMLSKEEILRFLSQNFRLLKENYGVKHIGVFGSYSRNKQTADSDIDILVEFEPSAITFDHYMDLKIFLEDHFHKPVDLVILDDIKPALKPYILEDVQYAEGA